MLQSVALICNRGSKSKINLQRNSNSPLLHCLHTVYPLDTGRRYKAACILMGYLGNDHLDRVLCPTRSGRRHGGMADRGFRGHRGIRSPAVLSQTFRHLDYDNRLAFFPVRAGLFTVLVPDLQSTLGGRDPHGCGSARFRPHPSQGVLLSAARERALFLPVHGKEPVRPAGFGELLPGNRAFPAVGQLCMRASAWAGRLPAQGFKFLTTKDGISR